MKNKSFLNSLQNAFNGLVHLIKNERNIQIQLVIAFLVLVAAIALKLPSLDNLLLILAIALVFICEAFNTCIEVISDKVEPKYCPQIKIAKDIGAAAVTLASILAIFIGIYVFLF